MGRFCERSSRSHIEIRMRRATVLLFFFGCFSFRPASAYQLLGSSWDPEAGPVAFHLEPNGSDDISDGSDLQALRDSFRRWACVPGSSLRFVEGAEPGVKAVDLSDGINTLFWDETGSFGLGPGTLGIAVGSAPVGEETSVIRDAADIVFNGFDSTWSTTQEGANAGRVDVASIAIHEIGHWLGLAHPCDDPQETQCLGTDVSVMSPTYPGGLVRDPMADDIAGLLAMYPASDASRCEGPYRQGEVCSCNDDCVSGLKCVDGLDGAPVCSPSCSAEDVRCPGGFACVLGARPSNGGNALGVCLRLAKDSKKPLSSTCERDTDCEAGICLATSVVGRTVCRKSCDVDEDCPPAYQCFEEVCVAGGATEGIACPVDLPAEDGCSCTQSQDSWIRRGPVSGLFALLLLGFGLRKRRSGFAKSFFQ